MTTRFWPLYGLRITTPRLELRLPDTALLDALAGVAAEGVHDQDAMPFLVPWTDGTPGQRGENVVQHVLGTIADWRPDRWTLSLAVLHEGTVVGRQDVEAEHVAVTREVSTGSWLGQRHQGQGFGTEMRAAVLAFAFDGLGVDQVRSAAFTDNTPSQRVSRRLGYRPDGTATRMVRGVRRTEDRLLLTRADWERHRTVETVVSGLEPCRAHLGLADGAA